MGTYISQSDVENVFGEDNVLVWSDLDASDSVDATRIATGIATAEEDVENRFRDGDYAIPFSSALSTIKDWCAKLAGLWLYECRPKRDSDTDDEYYAKMREQVDVDIDAYTSGQRRLNLTRADSGSPRAPVVV
ncbi:hypothetical protein DRH27_02960 [Candidatus Falkowbacteria bacterium]|nr:MAG: hypothetical protein DRH27_02960 [Candidatus Falkowbacteria bacterium]